MISNVFATVHSTHRPLSCINVGVTAKYRERKFITVSQIRVANGQRYWYTHHIVCVAAPAASCTADYLELARSRGSGAIVLRALQEILQRFDVLDGVPQDLHFGKSLVGICTCSSFQHLEGFVHLADVIKDTYSVPTGEASDWDQPISGVPREVGGFTPPPPEIPKF